MMNRLVRNTGALATLLFAAPRAAALSPLQSKVSNVVQDVQGVVADKTRLAQNAVRAAVNVKARLAAPGPLMTAGFFNKSALLGDGDDADGVVVSVVADAAQAVLVGGVPAGNIVCYYNEAGTAVGLQQGNVSVCGVSNKVRRVDVSQRARLGRVGARAVHEARRLPGGRRLPQPGGHPRRAPARPLCLQSPPFHPPFCLPILSTSPSKCRWAMCPA